MPMAQTKLGQFYFGNSFRWEKGTQCWRSTSGHIVKIFPPDPRKISPWRVEIPGKAMIHEFTGENAEINAYRVALEYTSQDN